MIDKDGIDVDAYFRKNYGDFPDIGYCKNKQCYCHSNIIIEEVWLPIGRKPEHHPIQPYQCQQCGEPIGYLGRFWQLIGLKFHKC